MSEYVDIRFLLVGSLLPDIIDKPLGHVFFRETFSNGRIFAHTLLFCILLVVPGVYLYRWRHRTWLAALAAGTFAHLILDRMWQSPQTLLWPLYGFAFPRAELTGWLSGMFQSLVAEPRVYVPELVGLVVLVWFIWGLVHRKTFLAFLTRGQVR